MLDIDFLLNVVSGINALAFLVLTRYARTRQGGAIGLAGAILLFIDRMYSTANNFHASTIFSLFGGALVSISVLVFLRQAIMQHKGAHS